MSIESENAKEEIKEIVEKCVKCGICKQTDSVFRVQREEQFSARGKAILLNNGIYNHTVYMDNLSGACEKICPLNIKMHEAIIKARKILVEEDKASEKAKEIIDNLDRTGNVFGVKK